MAQLRGAPPSQAADYIEATRSTYDALGYPPYQWVHSEAPPSFTRLDKPLAECRVGIVASGGVYRAGQIAFHFRDDDSYRVIPADVPVDELRATHFAYDLADAQADIGCVFPIAALRALEEAGEVGSLCAENYAFMGGIYSARRVREQLAPALRGRFVAQGVDVVLLVPV